MKVISFFNNKGGVGKTTLACNLAAVLCDKGHSVLLIDCDPQCNATLLVLGEKKARALYWPPEGPQEDDPTILDVVAPLIEGDAKIARGVSVSAGANNRFGMDVLPGHPRLSIVEDRLSDAWRDATSGDIGGLRKSSWMHQLVEDIGVKHDFVFLDLGPSLGSLNRTALLGSHYFCTPMGADIFSIVGLRNIAEWIESWSEFYVHGIKLCDKRHADAVDRFGIPRDAKIVQGYLGYTVQSYVSKYVSGVRRPTKAYEVIIEKFPSEVMNHLGSHLAPGVTGETVHLGDIPNMFSIVPLAQSAAAPVAMLRADDGVRGAHHAQVRRYAGILQGVAESLLANIMPEEDGDVA